MTIQAQLEDGTALEFPDDTDPAIIDATVRRHLAGSAPQAAPSALDRLRAGASGFNRGLVGLAGLPVDTALNVLDLGKAALGAGYGAVTGNAPPTAFDPTNRANVAGTSEWLANRARAAGAGQMIDNPNPQDVASRFLRSGAEMGAGALLGGPAGLGRNALMAGAGGVAMQGAAEAGLPPSSQILASILAPAAMARGAQSGLVAQQQAQQANVNNAVRGQTAQEALGAGYKIPPSMVNPEQPGMAAGFLETALAKRGETGQLASIKNQDITTRIAARAIGVPDTVPLTEAAINQAKAAPNAVYAELRAAGPQPLNDQFRGDINKVFAEYDNLKAAFPKSGRNAEIEALKSDLVPKENPNQAMIDKLMAPKFNSMTGQWIPPSANNLATAEKLGGAARQELDSSVLVSKVQQLRNDGYTNIEPARDPEQKALGRIQLGAANAIEDLMASNLKSTNPDLLQRLEQARTLLGRIGTVKAAFEKSSGRIVASDIGKQFEQDRPLSGGLETIGAMHQTFPRAVQDIKGGAPSFSPWDPLIMAGSGGGFVSSLLAGHPGAAATSAAIGALPLARVGARSLLLSGLGQRMFAQPRDFRAPLRARLMPRLANEDLTGILGAYLNPQVQ